MRAECGLRDQLGFLMREHVADGDVCALVAEALRLAAHEVALLDYALAQTQPALVQIVRREGGFPTDVILSIEWTRAPGGPLTGVGVRMLSAGFGAPGGFWPLPMRPLCVEPQQRTAPPVTIAQTAWTAVSTYCTVLPSGIMTGFGVFVFPPSAISPQ